MEKILFATSNPTKSKRFNKELLKHNIEVISLKNIKIELEMEENENNVIDFIVKVIK